MERFFRTCSEVDETEVIDLLLHRYGNLEYIMKSDIEVSEKIILKAMEKERENRLFLQWVVQLPNMTDETYISFDNYVDRVTGRNIDRRPVSECMQEIEEIKKVLE